MSWRALMNVEDEHFGYLEQKPQKEQKGCQAGSFATIATIADKGQKVKNMSEEDRYRFEERAAICQYDGGLSREEAEGMAREIIIEPSQNYRFER